MNSTSWRVEEDRGVALVLGNESSGILSDFSSLRAARIRSVSVAQEQPASFGLVKGSASAVAAASAAAAAAAGGEEEEEEGGAGGPDRVGVGNLAFPTLVDSLNVAAAGAILLNAMR